MTTRPTPEVTVIIPCYNMASTLPFQLEALATQEDAPQFEVIVVDNNSTDNVENVVRQWQERTPLDLRLALAHEAQGSSYARNVGIRESRAELLMFCDADDIVSRWWISHGVRNFAHADLWTGSAVGFSDRNDTLAGIRACLGDSREWQAPSGETQETFPVLLGGNFGARLSTLRKLGGFDQSMSFRGDDNDLAYRAHRLGVPVHSSQKPLIGFRIKQNQQRVARITFQSALAHALLASRYHEWQRSPFPFWASEPIRCIGAGVKMLTHPATSDWNGLLLRSASAAGIALGRLRYATSTMRPKPKIGVGWIDDDSRKRTNTL